MYINKWVLRCRVLLRRKPLLNWL